MKYTLKTALLLVGIAMLSSCVKRDTSYFFSQVTLQLVPPEEVQQTLRVQAPVTLRNINTGQRTYTSDFDNEGVLRISLMKGVYELTLETGCKLKYRTGDETFTRDIVLERDTKLVLMASEEAVPVKVIFSE